MKNKKSLLKADKVVITPDIRIRIPTVGEILEDEQMYYSLIHALTATPYQYMVQLDDMNLDFTTVTEYQLFLMLFSVYAKSDLSILLGDLDTSDFQIYHNIQNDMDVIYSPVRKKVMFDPFIYEEFADTIRNINLMEKITKKPGNQEAKKYLLNRERKKLNRNRDKPYEPYLEKLVIALVNTPEFKYKYDEAMDLSIYQFMKSFEQIQAKINFDKTMIGVYAGTIDTSKLKDKSCLSWIPSKL